MTRTAVLAALAAFALAGASPAQVVATAGPDLTTVAAVAAAGGGAGHFTTLALLRTLAGPRAPGDLAALTRGFGVAAVKRSIAIMDFTVRDAAVRLHRAGYAIPGADVADALDAKGLATTLHAAGVTAPNAPFRFDAMFDALVTRPIRVALMRDVDARYGERLRTDFARLVSVELRALATPDAP